MNTSARGGGALAYLQIYALLGMCRASDPQFQP